MMMTTTMPTMTLESVRYHAETNELSVLDQLLLPKEQVWIPIMNLQDTWSVIRKMQIRGAPLIAIVAVLGLAVDLKNCQGELDAMAQMHRPESQGDAVLSYIVGKMDYLATSRPTAVNLFHALAEIKEQLVTILKSNEEDEEAKDTKMMRMVQAVQKHALFMLERDRADNRALGMAGALQILKSVPDNKKVTVMTICNTGTLATSHYGTALGVMRALHELRRLQAAVCLETRPYNQGSRLTAFEILADDLPGATLICDSMAAAYMQLKGADACVVGADRVCANGDTANKIGTYALSISAAAHGVPFYVAAPTTTLDLNLQSGSQIVIEQRPANELLDTANAPANMPVWNPAFDVTPARNVAGIITEQGVILPDPMTGKIDVKAFVEKMKNKKCRDDDDDDKTGGAESIAKPSLEIPFDYTEQTTASLPAYLEKHSPSTMQYMGAASAADLSCVEMGDGNLNLVFIVTCNSTGKQVVVKQALPYVRCVGPSWPMTLERASFEYQALTAERQACPEHVPEVYHFDKRNGLMVMQYLAPPVIILRKGLIRGIRYPTMAVDMARFCAKTLFQTSGFRLSTTELRAKVQFWSTNTEMCSLTEQVIFTEPYMTARNNRWTTPELDDEKIAIENDLELKVAAAGWKQKFVTSTEALVHGDLHSGSVMCAPDPPGQTWAIDPEFAFYGPAGFDLGALVGNFFLAYVSQPGHKNGASYEDWILEQISVFWKAFVRDFTDQWNDPDQHTGYLYGRDPLGHEPAVLRACQQVYFAQLLADCLGFAGMKMLRRIVGIAHVEDLDSIVETATKAACEKHGLRIAKTLIKKAATFQTIEDAIAMARDMKLAST